MNRCFAEEVYESMQGLLVQEAHIAGVENAFEDGKPCAKWYCDMLDAYGRLCDRLGVTDEDQDVEVIISSLLHIQKELCLTMYQYGTVFGTQQP